MLKIKTYRNVKSFPEDFQKELRIILNDNNAILKIQERVKNKPIVLKARKERIKISNKWELVNLQMALEKT